MSMGCGCGRSPTGKCIGWHSLTEEQYQQKISEWDKEQFKKAQAFEKTKTEENEK